MQRNNKLLRQLFRFEASSARDDIIRVWDTMGKNGGMAASNHASVISHCFRI